MESASRQALATSMFQAPIWTRRGIAFGCFGMVTVSAPSFPVALQSIKLALAALGAPILRLIGPIARAFRSSLLRRWTRSGLRHDHGNDSVLVRHFGIRRLDIVGQRDNSLEMTERAFHQMVEPSLVMFGGPLFTTDTYAASIYRDIHVFLAYAGHFDFNDDQLRRFPRFTRQ